MTDQAPPSILAYDLHIPARPLTPPCRPTWISLPHMPTYESDAAIQRRNRERVEAVTAAFDEAHAAWARFGAAHADNPVIQAVLGIHQPEAGYNRVECAECQEPDLDDTAGVERPCRTYLAVKEAADA
jgi:hypothetical protein